ncbi:MAG: 4Fe-4S dicluster domain-containing protein, partial [Pseudomonadota bacterium]
IITVPLQRFMTTAPCVDKTACKGCGICMKACPAEAITLEAPGKPVAIKHAACIRCFCCQELCPEGAITAKDALGVKLLKALGLE